MCACLLLQDESNQDLVHGGRDTRSGGGISGLLSIETFWNGDLRYSADGYLFDNDLDQSTYNETEQNYTNSNGLPGYTLTTYIDYYISTSYDLSANMVIRDNADTIGNFSWWASHVSWNEYW